MNLSVRYRPLSIRVALTHKTNNSIEELELEKNENLYEEYSVMLESIKGDGAATISVEVEFADKNFGNGVSVKVFCSLSCNQSLQDVELGYQYANQIAQDQLQASIPEVRKLYERFTKSDG